MNLDNNLIREATEKLAERLPAGWSLSQQRRQAPRGLGPSVNVVLRIRAPGAGSAQLLVVAKPQLEPRDVELLANALARSKPSLPILVVARFLTSRTRKRLEEMGISYADLTGNVRLSLARPGLFIETSGAEKNPAPARRPRRSLKGAKAGRVVRALCDFRPPQGLRELAGRASVDPGYASRIVDFLDREALLTRERRGPITAVDWPSLLRRWAEDYSPFSPSRVNWYLAPRGLGPIVDRLRSLDARYAVSGSWAASQIAPVAPARVLLCYTNDVPSVATSLDLRLVEAGFNVALVAPLDPVVYERTLQRKGVTVAAPSQVAVDLMTSPGRGPNEADALIVWMREHEDAWRN